MRDARIVLSYYQNKTGAHRKVSTGREYWPPSQEEILEWLEQYVADPQAEVALVTIGDQYCQFTKEEAFAVLDISTSLSPTSKRLMSAGVIAVLAILEGVRAVSCHLNADLKDFLRAYNGGQTLQLTSRRIDILGEAMKVRGLDSYQVALKAGLSPSKTHDYLHNGKVIPIHDLNKILKVLGITIEHLW